MPKRTDIHKIMVIGSGPIIIGQACEFDYSGTQACKALKEENFEIVLVNSNPATIMTDPEVADRTYVEPITAEICEKSPATHILFITGSYDLVQQLSSEDSKYYVLLKPVKVGEIIKTIKTALVDPEAKFHQSLQEYNVIK